MNIDTHSDTWKAIEARLKDHERKAMEKLVAGVPDNDRQRGRIDVCREILGMPKERPAEIISTPEY